MTSLDGTKETVSFIPKVIYLLFIFLCMYIFIYVPTLPNPFFLLFLCSYTVRPTAPRSLADPPQRRLGSPHLSTLHSPRYTSATLRRRSDPPSAPRSSPSRQHPRPPGRTPITSSIPSPPSSVGSTSVTHDYTSPLSLPALSHSHMSFAIDHPYCKESFPFLFSKSPI